MFERFAMGLVGVLVTGSVALAQLVEDAPTRGNMSPARSTMVEWGIATVFVIGCLVVAFKPSKRSKLD